MEAALALAPDHLSCYCLILEPGTPLASAVRDRREAAPDEELQRDMFDWLGPRLARAGYTMYELSNYARPGRQSAHNLYYWTGRPFVGIGPSAHSGLDGRRGANPAHLEHYRAASRRPRSRSRYARWNRPTCASSGSSWRCG